MNGRKEDSMRTKICSEHFNIMTMSLVQMIKFRKANIWQQQQKNTQPIGQ